MFFHSLETGIGYNIVLWFQNWRTESVSDFFMPFNYLISEAAFLLILPLVYWCVNRDTGKRLMQTLLFSFLVNMWFKAFLARPRPYQVSVPGKPSITPALPRLDSHGIPSGHTQGAVTLFGFLAREAGNGIFTFIMIVLMILTALSRLVHGMHYPQDVAAGALLGTAVVFIYPSLYRKGSMFLHNLILPAQALLAVMLTAFLFMVYRIFISDATAFDSYIALASVYSFSLLGFSLERRYVRYTTRGSIINRTLRYVSGMIITLAFYIGLKKLFSLAVPGGNTDSSAVLRIIRYGIIGLWISWGAPAFFVRLGLAKRE